MTRRADRWWKGLSEEMLTRAIKTQLVLLTVLAVIAVVVLGWYFLRIPAWSASVDTRFMPNCLGPGVYTEQPTSHIGASP